MKTISFTKATWEDYAYWTNTDKKKLKKLNSLIEEITRIPFEGSGQPEQLKHHLSGFWSRRIDHENRLVYTIKDERIEIISCKGHYR